MERKGYQFIGWYVDEECTKRINPGGVLFNVTTLHQKWLPLNYPIVYKVNGGMNSRRNPRFINIEMKDTPLHPATKKDHIFKGWYLNGELIGKLPENHYGPLTLEAKFVKPIQVTFETNGGATMQPVDVLESGRLPEYKYPRRMGYEFDGWFFDKEFMFPFGEDSFITNNCTLYAKWKKAIYTITYDTKGGLNSRINPKAFTFDDGPFVLKPAMKRGSVFEGWYNQFGKKVEFIRKNTMGDISLTARYLEDNETEEE